MNIKLIAAIGLALTIATPAMAQWGGHHRGHGGYHGGGWGNNGWGHRGPGIGLSFSAAPVVVGPGYYAETDGASSGEEEAYCAQRFRSYDPASGTYLGFDGLRHSCP